MAILKESSPISSRDGELYITVNGQKIFMGEIIKFNCDMEKIKTPIKSVGRRVTGNKTVGANLTGSMSYYFVRSNFQEQAIDYLKTGKDVYYEAVVMVDDPTSDAGSYRVSVTGINFDKIPLVWFDASADDVLQAELPFTAGNAEILDRLNRISY